MGRTHHSAAQRTGNGGHEAKVDGLVAARILVQLELVLLGRVNLDLHVGLLAVRLDGEPAGVPARAAHAVVRIAHAARAGERWTRAAQRRPERDEVRDQRLGRDARRHEHEERRHVHERFVVRDVDAVEARLERLVRAEEVVPAAGHRALLKQNRLADCAHGWRIARTRTHKHKKGVFCTCTLPQHRQSTCICIAAAHRNGSR